MTIDEVRESTRGAADPFDICRYATEESPLPMAAVEGRTYRIRYVNRSFADLVGRSAADLLGQPFERAVPEGERNGCVPLLDRVYRTATCEHLADQPHGQGDDRNQTAFWSYTVWAVPAPDGGVTGLMIQIADTTESVSSRLRAATLNGELLASQIRQDELTETATDLNRRLKRAVRETNHRVKNNLQVVAALLELGDDEWASSHEAQRVRQHVRSLALIHDLLTKQNEADSERAVIPVVELLKNLLSLLHGTMKGCDITYRIEGPLSLEVKKASALALLLNECVSNCVKHGAGDVQVALDVREGEARLEICDNGHGFPPDFDPVTSANTGLDLVVGAAQWDLQGSVAFDNRPEGGARTTVTFCVSDKGVVVQP